MEPLLVVLLVVVAGANPEAPDARRTHTDHLFATRMFSFETTQIFYAGCFPLNSLSVALYNSGHSVSLISVRPGGRAVRVR